MTQFEVQLKSTPEDLERKIVNNAVERILRDDYGNGSAMFNRIEEAMQERIEAHVNAQCEMFIKGNSFIDHMLSKANFRKTDAWGKPETGHVSFHQFVENTIHDYLNKEEAKLSSASSGRRSRADPNSSSIVNLVIETVREEVKSQMREAMKERVQAVLDNLPKLHAELAGLPKAVTVSAKKET